MGATLPPFSDVPAEVDSYWRTVGGVALWDPSDPRPSYGLAADRPDAADVPDKQVWINTDDGELSQVQDGDWAVIAANATDITALEAEDDILQANIDAQGAALSAQIADLGSPLGGSATGQILVWDNSGSQWIVELPSAGIKLDDLATPDDNTDLNATSSHHGLLRKLSGSSSDVLKGDGTWGAAASGDPSMGGDLTGTASNAQIAAGAVGAAELGGTAATRALTLGIGGSISATMTDTADVPLTVPFNCTVVGLKLNCKVAPTGAMVVQVRKSADAATPTFADLSTVTGTFTANENRKNITSLSVNLSENETLNFSISTGSGSGLRVQVIVIPR